MTEFDLGFFVKSKNKENAKTDRRHSEGAVATEESPAW